MATMAKNRIGAAKSQRMAVSTPQPKLPTLTGKRGIELLRDPVLNKSTAFTEAEKQTHGWVGLVPDVTESEDLQLRRVLLQLDDKSTDLDRYIYLINLLDHNQTLFYRTVMSDPVRFRPIVYEPTIGEACLKFGHIYRQARGMYLSITRRGKVKEVLTQQSNILEAEIQTAARVAKLVFDSDLARVARPDDMVAFIRKHVYKPEYANEANEQKE